MKKVDAMQSAKSKWLTSQARRRVSHGIWKISSKRARRAWRLALGVGAGGKKEDIEADRVPGVPGVCGSAEDGVFMVTSGARYEGTTSRGSNTLAAKEVMAKINNANVAFRVASSHFESISSGVRSRCSSK